MEDTHGVLQQFIQADSDYSLNPYYNGRYSWRMGYSLRMNSFYMVLILIIMEDTHGVLSQNTYSGRI